MSLFIPRYDSFLNSLSGKENNPYFNKRSSSSNAITFNKKKLSCLNNGIRQNLSCNNLLLPKESKSVPTTTDIVSMPVFFYELFPINHKYASSLLEDKPYSKQSTKIVFSHENLVKEFQSFNIEIKYNEKEGDEKYFEILDSLSVDLDICLYKTGRRYLGHLNTSLRNVLNFLFDFKQGNILISNKDEFDVKLKETKEKISNSNYDYCFKIMDLKQEINDIISDILENNKYIIPSFFNEAKYQLNELNNIISEYYEYAQNDTYEIQNKLTQLKEYFEDLTFKLMSVSKEIQKLSKRDIDKYIEYYIRIKEGLSSVKDEFTDLHFDFEEVLVNIDAFCCAISHIHTKQ